MESSSLAIFILLLPLLILFNVGHSHSFESNIQTKCHKKGRDALLEFKATFYNESCKSNRTGLKTWKVEEKNADCCNWDGVECDENSGHVIGLNLSSSCLSGSINSSSSIFKLDHLHRLDLSRNDFRYSEIPSAICNLSRLESLYLIAANFSGQIPSEILRLTNLSFLYLSANHLTLKNPSLGDLVQRLVKLEELSLDSVEISSSIPDSLFRLTSLRSLSLVGCKMHGQIHPSLSNLTKLERLHLHDNQFTGEIFSQLVRLTKLEDVVLSVNKFSGEIPRTICHLKNLVTLYLDSNNFSGEAHLDVFFQIDSLEYLNLSYNTFSLVVNSSIRPRSKLWYLGLASCNLRSFPMFLQSQDSLRSLDLSSNDISGEIPQWFMDDCTENLHSLDLSHNHLSGFEGNYPLLKWSLQFLDLRFNLLKGPLPMPSATSFLQYYLVSNNKFSGELPTRVCDLLDLEILDIGSNNLSGMVPQCLTGLVGMGNLSVLNLHNNNFNGTIPPIGKNGCSLMMIDMSYNQLEGLVPRNMNNCIGLEFLNLGNNKIFDVFPFWLGNLSRLSVLILHANRFHGIIEKPSSSCMFPKLQIINLSNNYFTGHLLAHFFEGWTAMKVDVEKEDRTMSYASYGVGSASYFYTLTITYKGMNLEYMKVPVFLVGVDLSSNYFMGEIPKSIAALKQMRFLNLSNNMLTGSIPFCLNGLIDLESLDLSHNKLSGEIPQQLTDLTALELFDVSFNQLTGPIPQSKQFNTFENSSYQGNPGLCGLPLSRKCRNIIKASRTSSLEKNHASRTLLRIDWRIVSMGYTSGLVIGVVMGMKWTRGCKKLKGIC